MNSDSPPLCPSDYDRMHGVIRAVLEGAGQRPGTNCMFFSLAGAQLLDEFHGMRPTVYLGSALFGLGGDPPTILTFAHLNDAGVVSDRERFHAWIEVDDWAIDLMSPVFPENAASQGLQVDVPRKRFQRKVEDMAPSLDDFASPGSFGLVPDAALRAELMNPLIEDDLTSHMIGQCRAWYRPAPVPFPFVLNSRRRNGEPQQLAWAAPDIAGDW